MHFTTPANYLDVFEQFGHQKVRYVVISGAAVVLRGHVRGIVDLDIVVDSAPDEAQRAMQALGSSGFVPSIPLPLSLVTVLRMFDQSGREIDVFARYHIPFAELFAGSEEICIGNTVARVISLEHLLQTKRMIGRPHDLLDIVGLERVMSDE